MRKGIRRARKLAALTVIVGVTAGLAAEVGAGLIALPRLKEPGPPAIGDPDTPGSPQASHRRLPAPEPAIVIVSVPIAGKLVVFEFQYRGPAPGKSLR